MARDDGDGWGEEGGMKLTPEVIGKHVRLKIGQGVEYAEGRVVAYSLEPMLMIETPRGQIWWNASLAELGDQDNCGRCWTCVPRYPYMLVCKCCGSKRCPSVGDHHDPCVEA